MKYWKYEQDIALSVDGQIIETAVEFNFLGIWLDNSLSFMKHYNDLYCKLLKASFIVRNTGKVLPTSCLRTLYFAHYHSRIMYCLFVWWPLLSKKCQESLYILQKRVVRALCKAPTNEHCLPLFKREKILTIWDLATLEDYKLVYRVAKGISPLPIRRQYKIGCCVSSIKHSIALVNKSFLCKPVFKWQKLSQDLKQKSSLKAFSNAIKEQMCKHY